MQSAPEYRFYALPGGPPYRPGMVRVADYASLRQKIAATREQLRGVLAAALEDKA